MNDLSSHPSSATLWRCDFRQVIQLCVSTLSSVRGGKQSYPSHWPEMGSFIGSTLNRAEHGASTVFIITVIVREPVPSLATWVS